MPKEKYFSVRSSADKTEDIIFHKTKNGTISLHLGYSEVEFSVKDCRKIIEKMKECLSS